MAAVEDVNVLEMTHKMRLKVTDAPSTIVSKKLSYILRYGINRNVVLPKDAEGYFLIKDILGLSIFAGVTEEQVIEVIEASNNEKARYDLLGEEGSRRVKAAGHRAEAGERKEAKREERKKKKELTARYVEEKLRLGGVAGLSNDIHDIGMNTGNETYAHISPQQKNLHEITLPQTNTDSEQEFIKKWDLNDEAQQTLVELPIFQRYAVIQEFAPNPDIQKDNYSKVFINFCKRFKIKVAKMEDGMIKGGETTEPKSLNSAADPFVPSGTYISSKDPSFTNQWWSEQQNSPPVPPSLPPSSYAPLSPFGASAWNPYGPMWGMPPAMFMPPPPPPHMLKGLKGKGKGMPAPPKFDFFNYGAYQGSNAGIAAAMAGQQFVQMYNQSMKDWEKTNKKIRNC
jgi:RNA:NAD 2'-phosphotransferase (TPT1/KptA family)